MDKLALLGGTPVIKGELPHYNSLGEQELEAVISVMRSGCLSGFYGSWCDEFFGGPQVRAFEEAWSERFKTKHSISVNSASSGLFAAVGAAGVGPGDEVIVPPYTMSATVIAPILYGGIPVFADIEPETFCIDPDKVKECISPRTKAIIAVNLFGHPSKLRQLRKIADENNLYLVEDNAQGPLSMENGRYAGTVGHIGVFSLNYHKHIHTGEGGICVTDDDDLALRLKLIRNHGENAVEALGIDNIANLFGYNYRMTELSAAVGLAQLGSVDEHVGRRESLATQLTEGIKGLDGLTAPVTRQGCRHVSYIWALRFDETVTGVSRKQFSAALTAEGFPHFVGYVRPLYMLPIFQKRVAIGEQGFPFTTTSIRYEKGLCPVAERMHEKELICFETCMHQIDSENLELLLTAIHKVYRLKSDLRSVEV